MAERPKRAPVPRKPKKGAPHDHAKNSFGPKPVHRRLTRSEKEALRMAAELYYTLDLSNVTIGTMAKMPQFASVPQATLTTWAKQGDWDGLRQKNRQQWHGELKRKLSEQLVQHKYDEVMKLKQLHDQAFSYALGSEDGAVPAPPRTFAEAAKLYVALDQALSQRRDRMLESFGIAAEGVAHNGVPQPPTAEAPATRPGPAPQMALPEMTADEYQELAHSLMAKSFDAADAVVVEQAPDQLAATQATKTNPE